MKRLLIIILTALLTMALATPVFADTPAGGKPEPVTNPIILNELIVPGIWVAAYGTGDITRHVVKPNGQASTEDSWFQVTSFNGWIIFYPSESKLPLEVISATLKPETMEVNSIKVTFHNGTKANQPLITIRSSQPIHIPYPFNLIPGLGGDSYTNIQIMGITITDGMIIPTIIHAK